MHVWDTRHPVWNPHNLITHLEVIGRPYSSIRPVNCPYTLLRPIAEGKLHAREETANTKGRVGVVVTEILATEMASQFVSEDAPPIVHPDLPQDNLCKYGMNGPLARSLLNVVIIMSWGHFMSMSVMAGGKGRVIMEMAFEAEMVHNH